MLPDVGMVQMYSKSAKLMLMIWVLHGPALLFVPMVFLPGGLPCPSETHCIIPTSALNCFWRKHFYTPTYIHTYIQTGDDNASRLLAPPFGSAIIMYVLTIMTKPP